MAVYLISYDLNKEGPQYPATNKALIKTIRAKFTTYWHHLDSVWIVHSNQMPLAICDALIEAAGLDDNDEILVVRLRREAAWNGFNEKGSAWLLQNLPPPS